MRQRKVNEEIVMPHHRETPDWIETTASAQKCLLPLHRVPTWATPKASSTGLIKLGRVKAKALNWKWWSWGLPHLLLWVGTPRQGQGAKQSFEENKAGWSRGGQPQLRH